VKKVYQTRSGNRNGNCFQAAVASILELDLDEVPDFCNAYSNKDWWDEFVKWLNKRGITADVIEINSRQLKDQIYRNCYLLVAGKVEGVWHQVVYRNGKMVHDPNPLHKKLKPGYLVPKEVTLLFALDPKRMLL